MTQPGIYLQPTIKGANEHRRMYSSAGRCHKVRLTTGGYAVGAVSIRRAETTDYDEHAALSRYARAAGFSVYQGETAGPVSANVTVVVPHDTGLSAHAVLEQYTTARGYSGIRRARALQP